MPLDRPTPDPTPPPDVAGFDRVLTLNEAARMAGVSVRTLHRLFEIGEGPPRVQLTARRVGVWQTDAIAWLRARTAPAKRAA